MQCYKISHSEYLCLLQNFAVWISSIRDGQIFGVDLHTMREVSDDKLIDLMDQMDNVPYIPLEDLDPVVLEKILKVRPEMRQKVISWTFETAMDFIFLDAKDRAQKKELKQQIKNEKPLYNWLEKQIGGDEKLLKTFQQAVKKKSWDADAFRDLEEVLKFDKNWKKLLDRTNAYAVKGLIIPMVKGEELWPPGITEEEVTGDLDELKDSVNNIIRGLGLDTSVISKIDVTTDNPPQVVIYTDLSGIFAVVDRLKIKYQDVQLKF